MSRHYDTETGKDIIIDPQECRHLYDEVWCTNKDCPLAMDWIASDAYCRDGKCKYFEPENKEDIE